MSYLTDNLFLIRKEVLGVSAEKFSKFLGISSRDVYNNYESGRTIPSEGTIRIMAERIGIKQTDLTNRKLKKTDIPVIVINQTTQASADLQKVIEVLTKELEQKQVIIDYLTAQLKKDA